MYYTATYSPEDNKLRLSATSRLDKETYARVRAAGFIWAPKQDVFVAPMWTPDREDLCLELAGEIEDEDKSLVERAEERSDRFRDYSRNRAEDADQARAAIDRIANGIPLGQPILVGHHSEKHARRDAEKIENGMRRAVRMWETSQYWKSRAAGAIRAAKYKERPDVRARRIKGLEADQRKQQKIKQEAETALAAWQQDGLTMERALQIANFLNGYDSMSFPLSEYPRNPPASQYEGAMGIWSALDGGVITPEQARDLSVPRKQRVIGNAERWLTHIANRLEYERAMLADCGGTAPDNTGPEKGGACKCWASPRGGWSYIQKVNKVSVTVLDNWGNGGGNFTRTIPFDKLAAIMTKAQVQEARDSGLLVEDPCGTGFGLLTAAPPESKTKAPEATDAEFEAIRESLKAGVQVVSAPQLFPTPAEIAKRMVELADVQPGETVLEPSAGTGAIVSAVIESVDTEIVGYEINSALVSRLSSTFPSYRLQARCRDFLEVTEGIGQFPVVLMNPPFVNGADIQHIQHAAKFLRPGGRLVSLCANGPRQQAALKPLADHWEDLPAGSFKESGTGVNVAILVIRA